MSREEGATNLHYPVWPTEDNEKAINDGKSSTKAIKRPADRDLTWGTPQKVPDVTQQP
jgi:hypothetical protein